MTDIEIGHADRRVRQSEPRPLGYPRNYRYGVTTWVDDQRTGVERRRDKYLRGVVEARQQNELADEIVAAIGERPAWDVEKAARQYFVEYWAQEEVDPAEFDAQSEAAKREFMDGALAIFKAGGGGR